MNKKQKLDLLDFHAKKSSETVQKSAVPEKLDFLMNSSHSTTNSPKNPTSNQKLTTPPSSKFACHQFAPAEQMIDSASTCQRSEIGKYLHSQKPEHMPHCLNYLLNFCSEQNCPCIHVNLPRKTTVLCETFQKLGFCVNVASCSKWHFHKCPNYETCVNKDCGLLHERDWVKLKGEIQSMKNQDSDSIFYDTVFYAGSKNQVVKYNLMTFRVLGQNSSFNLELKSNTSNCTKKEKSAVVEKSFIKEKSFIPFK